MNKKTIVSTALVAALAAPGFAGAAEGDSPFTDRLAERYKEDVLHLHEQGIIGGFPDGEFKPDNEISRGAAAIMVARALGYTDIDGELLVETSSEAPSFSDVHEGTSYFNALIALEETGVLSGNPDGTFGPDDPVTRGAMAIMLSNGFNLEPVGTDLPFTDTGASSADAVQALYDYAITSGVAESRYGTDLNMIRSDFAVMVNASMAAEKHTEEAADILPHLAEVQDIMKRIDAGEILREWEMDFDDDEWPDDYYDRNSASVDLVNALWEIEPALEEMSEDNPLHSVIKDEAVKSLSYFDSLLRTLQRGWSLEVDRSQPIKAEEDQSVTFIFTNFRHTFFDVPYFTSTNLQISYQFYYDEGFYFPDFIDKDVTFQEGNLSVTFDNLDFSDIEEDGVNFLIADNGHFFREYWIDFD